MPNPHWDEFRQSLIELVRVSLKTVFWVFILWVVCTVFGFLCDVYEHRNSLEERTKRAVKEYEEYILGNETPPGWRTGEWETFRAEHPSKAREYLRKKLEKRYSLEPYSLPQ